MRSGGHGQHSRESSCSGRAARRPRGAASPSPWPRGRGCGAPTAGRESSPRPHWARPPRRRSASEQRSCSLWFSAELLSPRVQKPRNRPDRGSAIGKLTWLQRGTNSGARVLAAAQSCPKHGLLLSPAALGPAAPRPRRLCPATARSGSGRGSPPPPAPSRACPAASPSSSAGETYLPNRPGHPRSPKRLCASPRGAPPWISKRALPSWSSRASPRPGSPADNRAGCPWERASPRPPSSSACPALPRGRSAPAPASWPGPPAGERQPPPGPSSRDGHPERGEGARLPTAAAPREGRARPRGRKERRAPAAALGSRRCAPSARRQAPAAGAKRLPGRRGAAAHAGAAPGHGGGGSGRCCGRHSGQRGRAGTAAAHTPLSAAAETLWLYPCRDAMEEPPPPRLPPRPAGCGAGEGFGLLDKPRRHLGCPSAGGWAVIHGTPRGPGAEHECAAPACPAHGRQPERAPEGQRRGRHLRGRRGTSRWKDGFRKECWGLPRARSHCGSKAPPERVHFRTVPGGSGRSQTTTRRQLFIANL